jgi:hypothetical protein
VANTVSYGKQTNLNERLRSDDRGIAAARERERPKDCSPLFPAARSSGVYEVGFGHTTGRAATQMVMVTGEQHPDKFEHRCDLQPQKASNRRFLTMTGGAMPSGPKRWRMAAWRRLVSSRFVVGGFADERSAYWRTAE